MLCAFTSVIKENEDGEEYRGRYDIETNEDGEVELNFEEDYECD